VCVCVCACVCIFIYTHTHKLPLTRTHTHCVCVCVSLYIHTRTHSLSHARTHTVINPDARARTHTPYASLITLVRARARTHTPYASLSLTHTPDTSSLTHARTVRTACLYLSHTHDTHTPYVQRVCISLTRTTHTHRMYSVSVSLSHARHTHTHTHSVIGPQQFFLQEWESKMWQDSSSSCRSGNQRCGKKATHTAAKRYCQHITSFDFLFIYFLNIERERHTAAKRYYQHITLGLFCLYSRSLLPL